MGIGKKSAQKSAPGRPFRKGGDPRQGRGPEPGTGGRPPDQFKVRMRDLVNREDVEAYFERCLRGEFGPKVFLAARQTAKDDGYGKALQAFEVAGADGMPLRTEIVFVDPREDPR